jgi:hypothetical protein
MLETWSLTGRTKPVGTRRGKLVKPDRPQMDQALQLTNRRIRTFITVPSARNVNNTEDPP